MKRAIACCFITLLGVALIAGCSSATQSGTKAKPKTTTSGKSSTTTEQNIVSISNFSFDPPEITVKAGTEVTFKNDDSVAHTVTSDSYDSGPIQPGEAFKHAFDKTGTFEYHCSIHPTMTGKVVVE